MEALLTLRAAARRFRRSSAPRPSARPAASPPAVRARAPRGPCTRRRSVRPWPRSAARTAARARRSSLRARFRARSAAQRRRARSSRRVRASRARRRRGGGARPAIVAAGFGALENARRLCDAGASEATDGHITDGQKQPPGPRITAHHDTHDLIEHVRLGVETSVAAAEARLRVAELRARAEFRDARAAGARRRRHSRRAVPDGGGGVAAARARVPRARGRAGLRRERADARGAGAVRDGSATRRRSRGVFPARARRREAAARERAAFRATIHQYVRPRGGLSAPALGVSPRGHRRVAPARERAHAGGGPAARRRALDAAAAASAVPCPAARVRLGTDDPDDERASFARFDADPGEILNRLGLIYSHQGRLEEAAQRFERAIALGAARMRAASRDAEGPEASEASETAGREEGETRATYDDDEARRRSISSRARKIRRRVSWWLPRTRLGAGATPPR